MNNYTIEYDSHSIYLRQKSNEKQKERLESIRVRKNNFLPSLKHDFQNSISKRLESQKYDSPKKHLSVMDYGISFE